MKEYNELKGRLRQQAREAGLKRTDIEKTVKEVRNRKR
jgi:hypothetical protein